MTGHRTATLSHPGAPRDTSGVGRMDPPGHLLRICFLISLEGSSQFCNEETAGQEGPHLGGGGCRGTPRAHLLAVRITEGEAEVVLLQEVEVLAHHVKEHLASGVFLWETWTDDGQLVPWPPGHPPGDHRKVLSPSVGFTTSQPCSPGIPWVPPKRCQRVSHGCRDGAPLWGHPGGPRAAGMGSWWQWWLGPQAQHDKRATKRQGHVE